jgi:hydrogenase nickel incorporation protein HypA/HybF
MHELSLAQSIIEIVEKSVPEDFNQRIVSVHLDIGQLSGIEIDALTFAFSIIRKDTLLGNADLIITRIHGLARCRECGHEFELNEYGNPCPLCQSYSLQILQGKEMKVLHISVED